MAENNTTKIDWLDPREASELLDMTVQTYQRLARDRKIPARKIGGRWKMRRDELEQYLGIERQPEPRSGEAA